MKKDLSGRSKNSSAKFLMPLILILLIILISAIILIGHRPVIYAPPQPANPAEVSPYLTNQLLPVIYNGSQLGKPFEIEITQDGLNDVVSRLPAITITNDLTIARPQVILTTMTVIIIATVETQPLDLFLTIELNPYINKEGLLNLCINRVLLGKVEITSIARTIGSKAYIDWLRQSGTDPNNIASQICLSLLQDEPFDPVFKIYGRTLRVTGIDILKGKMIVGLAFFNE